MFNDTCLDGYELVNHVYTSSFTVHWVGDDADVPLNEVLGAYNSVTGQTPFVSAQLPVYGRKSPDYGDSSSYGGYFTGHIQAYGGVRFAYPPQSGQVGYGAYGAYAGLSDGFEIPTEATGHCRWA